jgi:hypothetical protein
MWKLEEQITVGTEDDMPLKGLRTRSQEMREGLRVRTYQFSKSILPLTAYGQVLFLFPIFLPMDVSLLNALMQAISTDQRSATKLPLSPLLTGKYVTSRGHPFCIPGARSALAEVAKENPVLRNETPEVGKIVIDVSEKRAACLFNVEEESILCHFLLLEVCFM